MTAPRPASDRAPCDYTGPIANELNGADISFAVGLVIAGGLHYLFFRSLDREAEARARATSQLELEGVPA